MDPRGGRVSYWSAHFFTWLQRAEFYRDLHAAAVALHPAASGQTWLDVGCGPGLVARQAARQGYKVIATDSSPEMVSAAQQKNENHSITYHCATLDGLVETGTQADVVSATSLLAVLDDPAEGLRQLVRLVKPSGILLVIETKALLSPFHAVAYLWHHPRTHGKTRLLLWSLVRHGRSPGADTLQHAPWPKQEYSLLGGLVSAWILKP